jgi:hypothetical protein
MRPTKHSTTGIYRVRLTIPEPLRECAQRLYGAKRELVANLETRDPKEATARAPEAIASLARKLDTIRAAHTGQGRKLSAREIKALAGELYSANVQRHADEPGDPDRWFAWQAALTDEVADSSDGSAEYVPDIAALADAEQFLARQIGTLLPVVALTY